MGWRPQISRNSSKRLFYFSYLRLSSGAFKLILELFTLSKNPVFDICKLCGVAARTAKHEGNLNRNDKQISASDFQKMPCVL